MVPIEELATIGLKWANKGDITENQIRDEHFINKRTAYSPILTSNDFPVNPLIRGDPGILKRYVK